MVRNGEITPDVPVAYLRTMEAGLWCVQVLVVRFHIDFYAQGTSSTFMSSVIRYSYSTLLPLLPISWINEAENTPPDLFEP
jgi:hypothetical protein